MIKNNYMRLLMIKIITCDCKILLMIKNNYMRLLMIKIITCDCKILLMIKIITCVCNYMTL